MQDFYGVNINGTILMKNKIRKFADGIFYDALVIIIFIGTICTLFLPSIIGISLNIYSDAFKISCLSG